MRSPQLRVDTFMFFRSKVLIGDWRWMICFNRPSNDESNCAPN